jgi:hypothetical protein
VKLGLAPGAHVALAIVVPLCLVTVLILLSPSGPFSSDALFYNQINGEFLYCITGVFWFGWRVGGETRRQDELPSQFWVAALTIFVIVLMLFEYASWSNTSTAAQNLLAATGSPSANLARYPSYYLFYVGLSYLIIFVGQRKIGAHKPD